jgi:outer membrane immunogenic protein
MRIGCGDLSMKSWTRGLGLALASALISAGPGAIAADYYGSGYYGPGYKDGAFAQITSWTGLYAGLNSGYAFDSWGRHGGFTDDGVFGGGQVGYNLQNPLGLSRNFVIGIEADFQGTNIYHSGNTTLIFSNGAVTHPAWHERDAGEFGTVRGRIGYNSARTLFYLTGGFAYGMEKNNFDDLTTGNVYKANGIQTGYAAGAGLEYKLAPSWSLKAEYQHIDLSADRPIGSLGGYVNTRDIELDTVRGGVNYHF